MLLTQPAVEVCWGPFQTFSEYNCGLVKLDTRVKRAEDVLKKQCALCKRCYAGMAGVEAWQELDCNEQIEQTEVSQSARRLL